MLNTHQKSDQFGDSFSVPEKLLHVDVGGERLNIYAIDIFTMVLQSPTPITEEIDVGRDLRWIPKYIENRLSSSSYMLQRETLSFILRPAAVHHDIYEEFLISARTMKDQAMLFSNHFRINYYEGTIHGIVISSVGSYVNDMLGSSLGASAFFSKAFLVRQSCSN